MEPKSILVTAPARLHCGLISVGTRLPVNFGGCGLMLREPATRVRVTWHPGESLGQGSVPDAVRPIVARAADWLGVGAQEFSVEILASPPRHCGFGSGTQLAMAVGSAMGRLVTNTPEKPEELAVVLDRGHRSALGTYGFVQGGFLVDRGLAPGERLARLQLQTSFPDWPVLLIRFPQLTGCHGIQELQAFDRIVATTAAERSEMERLVNEWIVPAVYARNFAQFSEAIYEFGVRSGNYYLNFQQGAFHSPPVANVVAAVRQAGFPGVVQSSWGPTLAVFLETIVAAAELASQLEADFHESITTQITFANNSGAQFEWGNPRELSACQNLV